MTDFMNEPAASKVVDRATFQADWMHCGFGRRLTRGKATPLRPLAHAPHGRGATPLIGEGGMVTQLDVFEGRRMRIGPGRTRCNRRPRLPPFDRFAKAKPFWK
jgi:hypothetical protein